ncbi:MAG: biotin--[acetyl-CoA-carboxylase] ligase [Oligoflexia bacterium]|nr:biotin--[acetyl-CoA-carboxylase] ligase [Oligoflexia bacterium]
MNELPFDLSETAARLCKRPNFGWNYVGLETVDSTQTYSKTHTDDFTKPTLIVAKHQAEGRGRGTNTWEDDGHGKSFLSTWFMELYGEGADPRWTLGIGLYLYESLSEAFKFVRFSLKAPNDIYIGDKKVGGVIAEHTQEGDVHYLHIGVGLNIFSYPTQHAATATHLNAYTGSDQLSSDTWAQFLDYFGTRLVHLEKRAAGQEEAWLKKLSPRLVSALNRHPAYQENPVKLVEGNGSLVLERGKINWQEL